MRLGVLFSGGKDSCFSCYKAMEKEEVVCLITIVSKNPESYMFHSVNIDLTPTQAEAIDLPIISIYTKGKKERELNDLKKAIEIAKETYKIEGITTGAISSTYQSTRIQKICDELDLWCFNPLWQTNRIEYMNKIISTGFKVLISGVFAYPFNIRWLGKTLNKSTINELREISNQYGISLIGEGGEFETFVYDGPIFKKRLKIIKTSQKYENFSGIYKINEVKLIKK